MPRGSALEHLGKNVVVALSLLAAGFFGAWLRFESHLGREAAFTDGQRDYDSSADGSIRYAVWEAPEPLAGAVQSSEGDHRPARSRDGRWLVFVSGERGTNSELYIAELRDGEAHDPRPLLGLNSTFDELAPAFGADALYFASNRPGAGGFDLWRADLLGGGRFGKPALVGQGVNTARDELDPAPLAAGGGLAFASNRPRPGRFGHDFYLALPAAQGPREVLALEALNSLRDDRELAFTADGRQVFFASDRLGQRGDFDLFSSLNEHGSWMQPQTLEGLNSAAVERAPAPDRAGFELYFERRAPHTADADAPAASLFHARSLEIFQRPGRRVGLLDVLVLIALLVLALLACLAKRWGAIEVLYKCFLVSILIHGALLWWFRDIHPESDAPHLPERSAVFQVQLARSDRVAVGREERAGQLDLSPEHDVRSRPNPERLSQPAQPSSEPLTPQTIALLRAAAPGERTSALELQ